MKKILNVLPLLMSLGFFVVFFPAMMFGTLNIFTIIFGAAFLGPTAMAILCPPGDNCK